MPKRNSTVLAARNGRAPGQGRKRKSDDRRSTILNSLWHLLARKGYSATSLTDIAREVGMSVSHLLYYFPNKDALFEEMYSAFSNSVLLKIGNTQNLPREEKCRLFADNMFLESVIPSSDETVLFEMLAYAAHNPRFRRTQEKHTRTTMTYLTDLLEHAPEAAGLSTEEAGAVVCALWFGFLVVSYMYKPMTPPRVRALFRRILLHLAGIDEQKRKAPTSPDTPVIGQRRSGSKGDRPAKESSESPPVSLVKSAAETPE